MLLCRLSKHYPDDPISSFWGYRFRCNRGIWRRRSSPLFDDVLASMLVMLALVRRCRSNSQLNHDQPAENIRSEIWHRVYAVHHRNNCIGPEEGSEGKVRKPRNCQYRLQTTIKGNRHFIVKEVRYAARVKGSGNETEYQTRVPRELGLWSACFERVLELTNCIGQMETGQENQRPSEC